MDSQRFDSLARAWTRRASRRSVFRSLGAMAVVGLVGHQGRQGLATSTSPEPAEPTDPSNELATLAFRRLAQETSNGQCVSPVATPEAELGSATPVADRVSPCADDADCATNQTCVEGVCEDAGCASDDDCPDGFVCQIVMCNWTGTWSTNWREMRLVQSGSTIRGDYDWDQGLIEGTVSGSVLSGTWMEMPSRQPPRDAGDLEFTMAEDCQSFTGRWRYGSSEAWRQPWDGQRLPD